MPLEFELCPGRMIGGNNPCFIIAEIGQNHQGDIKTAKEMIKMVKVRVHLYYQHQYSICINGCKPGNLNKIVLGTV